MTFQNITDDQAWEILQNYDKASNGRDRATGEHDYVDLNQAQKVGVAKGILNNALRRTITEDTSGPRLRYRYAKSSPDNSSTFPGRSTVHCRTCKAILEGADSR